MLLKLKIMQNKIFGCCSSFKVFLCSHKGWHQFRSKFINFGGNRCIWDPDVTIKRPNSVTDHEEQLVLQKDYNGEVGQDRQLEVEGSVVHIMKELASHPSAAQSLIEDDSLQLLFQMDAKGSLIVFSRYKEGLVPLHSIQLHRHAMLVKCGAFFCSKRSVDNVVNVSSLC